MEPNEKIKASRALNDTSSFSGDAVEEFESIWENKEYRMREDEIETVRATCKMVRINLKRIEEVVTKFNKLNKFVA